MATKYLSQSDLTTLESRIAQVFLKQADFNSTIASYSTTSQMNSAIASAIAGVTQFDYEIVSELPQEGVKGKIYLIANSGSGTNIYDEYIWIVSGEPATGHFELFGTQMVELIEYKGTGVITVTDGTGADAGKKVISLTYGSDFTTDANGLKLSAAHLQSLGLADTAIQAITSTGESIVVTGSGTTKNLEVSSAIQNGAAAGATALQPANIVGSTSATVTDGTGADAGKRIVAAKVDSNDFTVDNTAGIQFADHSIGAAAINALWTA